MSVATSVFTAAHIQGSAGYTGYTVFTAVNGSHLFFPAGQNAPLYVSAAVAFESVGSGGALGIVGTDFRVVIDQTPGPVIRLAANPTGGYPVAAAVQQMIQATAAGVHTAYLQYRQVTGRRPAYIHGNMAAVSLEGAAGVTGPVGSIGNTGATGPQGATGPYVGTFVGSGQFAIGQGVPMVEAALLSNRRYVGLAVATALSEVHVPTGTGDEVIYIGQANTDPVQSGPAPRAGGGLVFNSVLSGGLWYKGSSGTVTRIAPP